MAMLAIKQLTSVTTVSSRHSKLYTRFPRRLRYPSPFSSLIVQPS